MFNPDDCTGRLPAHFWESGAPCFVGGDFRLDAAMLYEAGAFLVHGGLEHNFQEMPNSSLHRTYYGQSMS